MAQRIGILNGANLAQDKDFWAVIDSLTPATSILVSGLAVTTNTVAVGRCLIQCTRTSTTPNEDIWVVFENTSAVTIDTSGTKKVWVGVDQTRINDGSLNTDITGAGIATIQTGANYPAGNYIPLAVITAGSIADARPSIVFNGLTIQGILKLTLSSSIASATTTDLSTLTGNTAHVTGNTTINSFGTLPAGTEICLIFDGTPTLTYNATSMKLPTNTNIVVAIWDVAYFKSEGSWNWTCTSYQRRDWSAVLVTPPNVAFTQSTLVAGEALAQWDALCQPTLLDTTITQNSGWSFNYDGIGHTYGQTVDVTNMKYLESLKWYYQLASAGTYTEQIRVYNTPGGTLLGTFSNGGLSSSGLVTTFMNNLNVSAYTSIYLLFTCTWGTANYFEVEYAASNVYAGWAFYKDGALFGGDLRFTLTWYDTNPSNRVFKANATNKARCDFIGFASTSASLAGNIVVHTEGVTSVLSGLTPWSKYYLSNTGGLISTTAGTVATPVGIATSATSLMIDSTTGWKSPAVVTPTVWASPYTYQNTTWKQVFVSISGGTVSSVQVSRDNSAFYQTSGATNTYVVLWINDYVKITYTGAPAVTVFNF